MSADTRSMTWFVTRASRGLGRELTEQPLARRHRAAATLRRPEQLDDLAARHRDRLWVRFPDVTDTAQMRRVVAEAFANLGRVDAMVSNACFGVFGAAEDLTDEQVDAMVYRPDALPSATTVLPVSGQRTYCHGA